MAPSTASPRAGAKIRKAHQTPGRSLESHKATGITATTRPASATKSDNELAEIFKSDLQKIQNLVMCTICNQLLYEPWTLACGHTYCYSCLCSWFVPNKRKKTCPDCRTMVKQMPAPAFLIKQMVEVFIDRVELMPIDETPDQHQERRQTESEIVEADRASDSGLFKGCFNKQNMSRLQFNEEDHVYRCSQCSHEYIGGPMCENCGLDFEGDEEGIDIGAFSDVDDEDSLDGFAYGEFQTDFDGETDEDDEDVDDIDDGGPAHFWGPTSPLPGHAEPPAIIWASATPSRLSDNSSSENSEDEEETESMRDFINDEPQIGMPSSYRDSRGISHASIGFGGSRTGRTDVNEEDDEYDEGGAVSNGRRRSRPSWAGRDTSPVVTVTDSTTTSEAGDLADETRRLQESGWSPLEQEQEQDSDYGEHQPFVRHPGDSDSDTTVGNQASDDDDDDDDDGDENEEEGDDEDERRPRGNGVPWNRSQITAPYSEHNIRGHSVESNMSDDRSESDAYDSEAQEASVTDLEGDVEMSISPVSSRRNGTANNGGERRLHRPVEILGPGNAIHDIGEESSDGTVQPASRRRRQPRDWRHSYTSEYDPRISMMFAQHQLDLRDATARQSPYFEPASRSRIAPSYRHVSSRGPFISGNAHLPSAVILTSVSNRPNRVQRQYPRRHYYN